MRKALTLGLAVFAIGCSADPVIEGPDISEIVVNPERYFIGNWTQQWLYLRQCAHINLAHPIRDEGDKGFNFDDEESADCWAVNRLREDPLEQGFSDRALRDIERDIAYVVKKGLWRELLPGPERPVDLMACKND